jgi:DNA-binding response OmpR family regulator
MIKVFLIDDSVEFIDSAKRFLEAEGLEVVGYAYSGKEGLEKIRYLKPDIVFVDIVMPEINGFSVAKVIKEMEDPPKVVILTLYDNPEYRKAGKEIGVDDFISKSELATDLSSLLERFSHPSSRRERVKNILIVDDSKTFRKMVISVLSKLKGVQFEEAETGLYALEKIGLKAIDLVILDLNMPDMHGLDVLRFLRSSETYKDLPIIVLTTREDDVMKRSALEEGANIYLTKPFNPVELIERVEELLGLKGGGSSDY